MKNQPASAPLSDWHLLVALLGPTGSSNLLLGERGQRLVRERCDGFGRMTAGELEALGILYDWSHVRDSSEHAIADAAALARKLLGPKRVADVAEVASVLGVCKSAGKVS